jgi:hypothetical protein
MMSKLLRHQKTIVLGLIPTLLCLFIDPQCFAQDIRWMERGDIIFISYDLVGSPEDTYDVQVVMKLKNDTTFVAIPFSIEGDAGVGHFAGISRGIRWHYRQDFPQGFGGDSYYFEITAKRVTTPTNNFYYLIGGSAIAAAGVIALIVSLSSGSENTVHELPLPPGRP